MVTLLLAFAVGRQTSDLAAQPRFGSGDWVWLVIAVIIVIAVFVAILVRGEVSRPRGRRGPS